MGADIKTLLLGLLILILLAIYSFSDFKVGGNGVELRKADFTSLYNIETETDSDPETSVAYSLKEARIVKSENFSPDTAKNFLFIGDSMLEGLSRRLNDYAEANGHKANTVIWYSSTSKHWAASDTLEFFVRKFRPDYILICLGSNELFVKDVEPRRNNIQKIIQKIDTIPFIWISPPNWKDDTGINNILIEEVGEGRYFDSRSLELERGKDHAHPTFSAAAEWMDTVARWLQSTECAHPVRMSYPDKEIGLRNVTLLSPVYME